jgi:hypothetical protein
MTPSASALTLHASRFEEFLWLSLCLSSEALVIGDVGWTLSFAICHARVGKNFSHKGKKSRKNGKWIHTSRGNSCQFVTDAVKSCQEKGTAYSLLNKRYPNRLSVWRINDGKEQAL